MREHLPIARTGFAYKGYWINRIFVRWYISRQAVHVPGSWPTPEAAEAAVDALEKGR